MDPAGQSFQLRWSIAAGTTAVLPVLLGAVIAVTLRPVGLGVGLGVAVALAFGVTAARRVRRRTLTVFANGLTVQRDKYALTAPWSAVTGVRQRKLQGLLPVDELVLSESTVLPRDSRGRPSTVPAGLAGHPALLRIQVSLYDRDWRAGLIGAELRRHGVDV